MWFLSPSGWPTSATDGSLFAQALFDRGWQVMDASEVQAAVDAYNAGQVLVPTPPDYVDDDELAAAIGGIAAVPDATATVKGKVRLTGDLGGTADAPTVPGLAGKVDTSTFTAALANKVNMSAFTAGLANKQDKATLGADVAADPAVRAASVAAVLESGAVVPTDLGATVEDLAHVAVLDAGAVSAARTQIVLTAPYPCRLDQFALSMRADVPASDTDYWTVQVVRYHVGGSTVIATGTTKAAGGQPVRAWRDWNFDAVEFSRAAELGAGDGIAVRLTPTGAPAALDGPTVTLRAAPSDGAAFWSPNLQPGGEFESDAGLWTQTNGTRSYETGGGAHGPGFLRLTRTPTAGGSTIQLIGSIPAEVTARYTVSAYVRSPNSGRTGRVSLTCLNSTGGFLAVVGSTVGYALTTDWQRLFNTVDSLPAGTASLRPMVEFLSAGGAVGDVLDADSVMLNVGGQLPYEEYGA